MNKLNTFIALAAVALSQSAAWADDYLPLTREGVKWTYVYAPQNGDSEMLGRFTIELVGDTVIDGLRYKMCWRQFIDGDEQHKAGERVVVGCVREDDRRVYARLSNHDAQSHADPGIAGERDGEWLLYDFNDVPSFYALLPEVTYYTLYGPQQFGFTAQADDRLTIGDHECAAWQVSEPQFAGTLVEGYGMLGETHDHWLDPYFQSIDTWSVCAVRTLGVYTISEHGQTVYHSTKYDGQVNTDPQPQVNADVNGDGTVDIDDVNAVVNALLQQ